MLTDGPIELEEQAHQSPDRDLPSGEQREGAAHHDALEFPDGRIVLLTLLREGQVATVLQLPAQPKTEAELREQVRVGFVG